MGLNLYDYQGFQPKKWYAYSNAKQCIAFSATKIRSAINMQEIQVIVINTKYARNTYNETDESWDIFIV